MDQVFLVMGESGEYDDYSEWIDSIHPTYESAVNRIEKELKVKRQNTVSG